MWSLWMKKNSTSYWALATTEKFSDMPISDIMNDMFELYGFLAQKSDLKFSSPPAENPTEYQSHL